MVIHISGQKRTKEPACCPHEPFVVPALILTRLGCLNQHRIAQSTGVFRIICHVKCRERVRMNIEAPPPLWKHWFWEIDVNSAFFPKSVFLTCSTKNLISLMATATVFLSFAAFACTEKCQRKKLRQKITSFLSVFLVKALRNLLV